MFLKGVTCGATDCDRDAIEVVSLKLGTVTHVCHGHRDALRKQFKLEAAP